MKVKSMLRQGLSALTAFGLLTAQLLVPSTAVTAANVGYVLTGDKTVISSEEIAQGDATVHVTLRIEDNPGLASVLLTFAVPDGFTMANGGYCDPYCFGDGSVSSAGSTTSFNNDGQKLLWNSGQNGGVQNDLIYDADLPFAEFDIIVPQGTPDGRYEIGFITEPIEVGTDANGNPLYRSTSATYRIEGSVDIVTVNASYQSCFITVGEPDTRGDVNLDGVVDSNDAQLVLQVYARTLLGEEHGLTEQQFDNADLDDSGAVNSLDAVFILRYYAAQMLNPGVTWEEILTKK